MKNTISEHATALKTHAQALLEALGLPKVSLSVSQNGGVSLSYYGKTAIAPPPGAEPRLSDSYPGVTGAVKIRWTWKPAEDVAVEWTSEHPASEAYWILSEYAARLEDAKQAQEEAKAPVEVLFPEKDAA